MRVPKVSNYRWLKDSWLSFISGEKSYLLLTKSVLKLLSAHFLILDKSPTYKIRHENLMDLHFHDLIFKNIFHLLEYQSYKYRVKTYSILFSYFIYCIIFYFIFYNHITVNRGVLKSVAD